MANLYPPVQFTGTPGSLQSLRWGRTHFPFGSARFMSVLDSRQVSVVASKTLGCWEKEVFLQFDCGPAGEAATKEKAQLIFWSFLTNTPASCIISEKSAVKAPSLSLPDGRILTQVNIDCYTNDGAEFIGDFIAPHFFPNAQMERDGNKLTLKFVGDSEENLKQEMRLQFGRLQERSGYRFLDLEEPPPVPVASAAVPAAPAAVLAAPAAPAGAYGASVSYTCGAKCHQNPVYQITEEALTLGQGHSLTQMPLKEPTEADWEVFAQEAVKARETLEKWIQEYPHLEEYWAPVIKTLKTLPDVGTALEFEIGSNLVASVPERVDLMC